MSLKTTLLTGAAGLVLSATLAGIPSASAENYRGDGRDFSRHGTLPRVSAQGAAQSQYAARMQAVHNWRDKVADRYGYAFSYWFTARAKDVDCHKFADDDSSWDNYGKRGNKQFAPSRHYDAVTRCTVSAIPSRGWGFGWNSR
jgi:hypothetical protein